MSLMRRTRSELEWPDWLMGRRGFDWPSAWKELLEDSDLRVEEFQEDGELVVRAEMPGIDPDRDVDISLSDHVLRLAAERRETTETTDKQGFHSEFRYGSFSRTIPLPAGVTEADVKATYVDGILEVRLPVDSDEAEAHKIPVTRG